MPRKNPPSHLTKETPLALSQLHIRLQFLEKEHQSLLKQIKRKRTELNNFVEQTRTFATEIFHKASPSFQKMAELDQDIHALFDEIFTTRKFGKQTLKNIEAVYLNLQLTGIISLKPNRKQFNKELEELFDNPDTESDFSSETAEGRHEHWQTKESVESQSVARTEDKRKIREIFLRLAEIFHPDKVKDSETQTYYTEIMKSINQAYQEGDLARLLEIERLQQVGEVIDNNSEDDLTRKCRTLSEQNQILLTQYENLKRELRLAKNTPEGTMVSDSRKAAKKGIDSMAIMVETIDNQINVISQIRDFVKDFKEQNITIKEFLAGPPDMHSADEEIMEDILEQMLLELIR
ncbi:heat shock protein DnaJ domain-containing protein [Nostoc commune NIES-4072]|uniref:Heat shock protein DnaJ domain-containing protein n=1 Tax=Nostoc commune NIES-4072 TaxID=2005467 RepID=A0A2R5FFB2_NOSCO|nr:J domain-containing protein [Nostoc commune]BBD66246.1 heat shock protein DnaJ domain-containing protein [Nostoc commune HK-02]GBG16429.1 heat shock protein DnaJ domain-containing protein [Nostoc commune NIES-4072]